ncbi:hypothetical protein T03_14970 [Trichinella britovi]|uniref:RRM domain-containing protein n=1 Tax=Trichinella britovi TaxID=45882 RepID=A0A0V1CS24_TRIBR|nr:hypothetical protein T03_14970 [Trichinella britovi]
MLVLFFRLLDTTMTELRHSIEHGAVLRNFLFEIFSLSAQDPLILFKYQSMLFKLECFTQERRNFVHNMIFVEIFNGRTTTEHLFSHFSSYGKVLHVEIRPENPHVAIVTFQTAEMARSACYICKEFHFPNYTIMCSYIYNLEDFFIKSVRNFLIMDAANSSIA